MVGTGSAELPASKVNATSFDEDVPRSTSRDETFRCTGDGDTVSEVCGDGRLCGFCIVSLSRPADADAVRASVAVGRCAFVGDEEDTDLFACGSSVTGGRERET